MKKGVVVLLVLAGVLGIARASLAATGVVRVLIAGALAAPMGTSADGQITLRVGVGLPVFLVNGNTVTPGSVGTATFAQWTDTMPTTGFGSTSNLMVFRLGAGFTIMAGGAATPSGFVTTFSATTPAQTLSGAWTMASGLTVNGGGGADALVTFAFDTNPTITLSGSVSFVAGGAVASLTTKPIPAFANVDVLRDILVSSVVNNAKGPQSGILASHSAYGIAGGGSEYLELKTIDFGGGLYLIYGCAFPNATSGIACLVGATGSAAHLSGTIFQLAGMFSSITGVIPADLVLRLTGRLP